MKKTLFLGSILVLVDQIIKWIIVHFLEVGETINIITDFFRLTYVKNIGAAWSLFEGGRVFLIFVTLIALLAIYFVFMKDKKLTGKDTLLYGFLIGGIVGNLIDRIFRGYVVDYLSFTIFKYEYPIFNLADTCIVISAICIIIKMIWEEKNEHNKN